MINKQFIRIRASSIECIALNYESLKIKFEILFIQYIHGMNFFINKIKSRGFH